MLVINWKGKIGYGDIISPICYAHNVAYKLDTKVKLVFHWNHGSSYKFNSEDPETLMQRADYVYTKCIRANVEVVHRYNSPQPKTFNHDNYIFADDLHNFWYSQERHIGWSSDIVINGTHNNAQTMAEYGKKWKDPVGPDGWLQLKETMSKECQVHDVSYRTPIKELFKQMRRARVFVGYHGTAAWVARFLQVPMVIVSGDTNLTQISFPHACVKTRIEPDFFSNIDRYISHSKKRLDSTLLRYQAYKLPEKLTKSFVWT